MNFGLGQVDYSILIKCLTRAGVPCGAVRDLQEVFADAQVAARHMIEVVDHPTAGLLKVLGIPIKLSDTPGCVRTPPPTLGQHTEQVLRDDLGIDIGRIRELAYSKVVSVV